MEKNNKVFIGLGSNLENPVHQLENALKKLRQLKKTEIIECSSFYRSKAWGIEDQDDFVNAVVQLDTWFSAHQLLAEVLNIEAQQGRIRNGVQWGPRVLDIDILLFNDEIILTESLQIPHYLMHQRAFVLVPLLEIDRHIIIPGKGAVAELVASLDQDLVWKIQ